MEIKILISELVRHVMFEQVRKRFDMDLPDDLRYLATLFKAAGHQLFVVGGSVRDALMGNTPKDYDVATDASPDRVIEFLRYNTSLKILPIGKSFGVIKVITPSGGEYEIATFRKDLSPGRRPDAVEFSNIETDVQRRDLTINALFYDIDKGEIVDFVGGIDDIKNGIVKAVGDPALRFSEDKLRILRALRFAGRTGSELDYATSQAIKKDNKLTGVSPERIRDEFLKGIRVSRSVLNFFNLIEEYDLWAQIFPGLNVERFSHETKNIPVVISHLLWNNTPEIVSKRLNVLKYSADEVSQISFLLRLKNLSIENAFRLKKSFFTSKLSNSDIKEFSSIKEIPNIKLVNAFIAYSPSISGDELIKQGFQGSLLGKEIERLETKLFKELL